MMQGSTDLLVAAGMEWKPGSLQVIHSESQCRPCCFHLQQSSSHIQVASVDRLEGLGAILSSDGCSLTIMQHRITKGTACFYSLGDYFLNPAIPLYKKFAEFHKRVQPTVLYSLEACAWSQTGLNLITRWENALFRRMCKTSRQIDEDFGHYVQRSTLKARRFFH